MTEYKIDGSKLGLGVDVATGNIVLWIGKNEYELVTDARLRDKLRWVADRSEQHQTEEN